MNTRREVQHIYDLDIEGHKFRVVKTQGENGEHGSARLHTCETLRPSGPAEAEGLICQSLAGAMTSFDF